ncbi:adhesive plaque matrix protein-like [Bactrocera tryoni]|uniref:adhesive plaque matrix protein-like n=1 Tax=Bactrocera tryoni TaxID=59916 RepID=UPI001A970FAE|nr:adhesive plaque matrix protein-like [Bactrocera tryoni]
MLIQRVLLVVTALCWSFHAANGDTKPEKLTSFRPITQAEYEAILSLTDGETVVSEGRLINGGLAALAGLTTGWVTSLRFPNIFGSFMPAQKSPNASYPLCVIRTEESPESQHHHEYHGYHEHHNRQGRSDDSESHESSEDDYYHYVQQQYHEDHSHEDHSGEHFSSIEIPWNMNKLAPVVNCIVVLREDENHGDDDDQHYHHTTTKRPKRKRRKHRPYPVLLPVAPPTQYAPQHQAPPPPPPSPAVAYPYSAAQSPYSPYGSYNNPWYWQTPYYNPYSSEPTTFTAYPDIYATNNPGPNTRSYPSAYSGPFASSPASNNPGPYYDATPGAYSDPPPSAYPSDSYNPQPSSYTSHYSNQRVAVNRESPSQNSEPSYNYGPPPNRGSFVALDQEPYKNYYDERIRENHKTSAKPKKSASASKMPKINKKPKAKSTAKPRLPNDHIDSASTSTKIPIRGRHTKVKRDESGIQTRSYAKIASYSESGYQPTLYPQYNYQSSYPKVSYTHALPYPAPVYVRNSIEQLSTAPNTKQYRAYANDAENEGYLSEHMQARRKV